MTISVEDRLKRRKLDALKRGVHRGGDDAADPVATHVVGIGKAGAAAIAAMLASLPATGPKFTALAIDIGDSALASLRDAAAALPPARAEVTTLPLAIPDRDSLLRDLGGYPEFLTLEYPRFRNDGTYRPWLSAEAGLPSAGSSIPRAVAKAIYGQSYYAHARPAAVALRNFAAGVERSGTAKTVVAIVFGLGGGTGSGIAVDLARHLSCRIFGRRVLVAGIGIAPCDGDAPAHRGASLFTTLNEIDCLCDDSKNQGIVQAGGELFRNPFTAGFIMVPQQQVWATTRDLGATHRRCDRAIATLLTGRNGANLWELLRLLNWVAAPSTQHSAARTPWGPNWLHVLGYAEPGGLDTPDLPAQLGVLPSFHPEYIEIRLPDGDTSDPAPQIAALQEAFAPDVPPQTAEGGGEGIQFILPCAAKSDLAAFATAQRRYDALDMPDRLLAHSLLLDHGVLLCEPSTQLEGMAGASLWGAGWTAVPFAGLRAPLAASATPVPELVA